MNLDWLADQGLERLPQFLTALAIGLLIGLDANATQQRKQDCEPLRWWPYRGVQHEGNVHRNEQNSFESVVECGKQRA